MQRVREVIKALQNNEIVIVTDDESRENEGDMICAGFNVTGEMVNIMASFAKGLICTPISSDFAQKLDLNQMVIDNTDNHGTAFTVSIDHIDTTTGISAYERAYTIRKMCEENSIPKEFRRPGHVFPLVAREGGVLIRDGHTEATIDLMKLSGLPHVGLCCEIMDDDGHMMRGDKLKELALKFNMKMVTIEEIKDYIIAKKEKIEVTNPINLPTEYGVFKAFSFIDDNTNLEHLAIYKGDLNKENILTRIHSECLTGDVLGSKRCDCGDQLHKALQMIEENGSGMVLYLRQEGRGIGLFNKLRTYELQEKGFDTVDANIKLGFEADLRDYKLAVDLMRQLGIKSINLLTNNPDKINQVEKYGIKVNKRVPIEIKSNDIDKRYLEIKAIRMGHKLNEFKEA